jgi:hypothetical protein
MGGAGTIGTDQQPPAMSRGDLGDGPGQHVNVIIGMIRSCVPGPQHDREQLVRVVAPHPDRVEAETVLERGRRLLFLRVRRDQRRVHVQDDGLAQIHASHLRGGHPGQLVPHVAAHL